MTETERFTTTIDPPDLVGVAREAADLLADIALLEDVDVAQQAAADQIARRLTNAIAANAPLLQRVWTVNGLAEAWRVSAETVRGWIDDGDLEVFNVGRGTVPHWRIVNVEALRFADARRKRTQ